ncbi:MAG: ABC transporter permease [Vicinamibacterales bacterium]
MLAALVVSAALAPWLAPYGPEAIDLANRRAAPSASHWFGTDDLGRDLFARVLFGGRVSLAVGFLSALVAGGIGAGMGRQRLPRGRRGHRPHAADRRRVVRAAAAAPDGRLGRARAVDSAPGHAHRAGGVDGNRTRHASRGPLDPRTRVRPAAQSSGASPWRIVLRHLLPVGAPAIAVAATLAVGRAILMESALSFFGVGVQPPAASWGTMLYQAQSAMSTEPWLALFPGMFIFATVLAINALGHTVSAPASVARR